MRCRLLTVAAVCTPLALAGQQATLPMSAQQVLDLPGAVRFEAVERYQPTVQGSGPVELRLGSLRTLRVVPTDQVVIPIVIDPTTAPGTAVAAFSATISWNPQRLSLDSIVPGSFGSVQINTAGTASGALALSVFATEGATQPTTVGTLYLRAGPLPGGTTVSLLPTQLGDTGGASLLRQALTRPAAACVAPPGNWGDANDDGQVNIIDAQQIARRSIALPVFRPAVLTAQGDVNADSVVDIIDAQQVARASIGLTAATRIGTPVFTIPPVFEILLGSVTEPLGVGEAAPLVASPRASDGLALDGCVPITWSSTSPAVAGVDSTGILRGLDLGSATITASAGGVSASTTITTIDRASVVTGFTVVDGPEIATYPDVQTGQPVRIRVTNEFGAGIPNIPVTVAPSGGTALIGPVGGTRLVGAKSGPITAFTDTSGIAIVRLWGGTAAPATGAVAVSIPGRPAIPVTVTTIQPRKGEHICMADNWSLRCWGDNARGQLGNGTTTPSLTPVTVTLGGVTLGPQSSVSQEGMGDHTCLTDANGDAYCWGSNTAGQIGDSTFTDRLVPTRVRTTLKFTKIVTGGEHSCALTAAGEIWCWGYNWAGQLGDGTFSNRRAIPARAGALPGVAYTDVSAGTNHTCGGTASGTWYCWGVNTSGQLGDGTTLSSPTPVLVAGGTLFAQVVGGEEHSCGRTGGGDVSCWGDADVGALGDGRVTATLPQVTPVPVVTGTGFTYLYAGYYRTCGIKSDFTTWCWGYNYGGQLGDGTTVTRGVPTLIPFTGYALKMSGTGFTASGQTTCGLTNASQQVFCWGSNLSGKLATGTDPNTPIRTPQLIPRVGAPTGVAAAVTPLYEDGGVSSHPAGTGSSQEGWLVRVRDALGAPVANQSVTFTVLGGSIRIGTADSTITVQTDTAGIAGTGPLSTGTTLGLARLRASIPVTTPSGQSGLARFVAVGRIVPPGGTITKLAGDSVLVTTVNFRNRIPIVLRVDGPDGAPVAGAQVRLSTLSPSDGSFGATPDVYVEADAQGIVTVDASQWTLGTGPSSVLTVHYDGTQSVTITRFRSTAPAPLTSCELTAAGTAYCWGNGLTGAVGNGASTTSVATPTAVSGGLTFTQLATGTAAHKCGLVGTTAYCWGLNDAGQLGDGTRTNRTIPTLVSGGLAFAQIATGAHTTCGLTTAGALYCWGWSGTAGFGLGDAQRGRAIPLPVAISTPVTFTKLTLADDVVCGLTSAGELWCRGDGLYGWNLDGTSGNRTTFTRAAGGPWRDASASYLGICAIAQADGRAYCGGLEVYSLGSLGTGVPINGVQPRLSPVSSTTDYASIEAFPLGACARTSTGDTDCWGSNGFGQTGTGTTEPVYAPTRIDGLRFTTVRAGAFRSLCGKVASGFLYCWGQNSGGQLGTGTASSTGIPTPTAVSAWPDGPAAGTAVSMAATTAISASPVAGTSITPTPTVVVRDRTGAPVAGVPVTFTLLTGDGTITGTTATTGASGLATLGSLVLGTTPGLVHTVRASAPGLASITFRFTPVAPAASFSAATNTTQYVFDWESYSRNPLAVLVRDANGQPIANYPVTYAVSAGNGTIAGGSSTTAVTNAAGIASIQSWSTPTGTAGTYTLTASVPGLTAVSFTMVKQQNYGGRTTCRMKNGAAYCWGDNNRGEAGTGGTTAQTTPAVVTGGIPLVAFAEGNRSYHQCGLTAAGAAYCWGDNGAGELGNGTRTASAVPVPVSGGLTFSKLFKGIASTCGITVGSAQLHCWGWMSHSRLGDATVADIRTVPTPVSTNGLTFTSVALALDATCGLTVAGGVHCWSNTNAFILGDLGVTRHVPSAAPIPNLIATQITASDRAFCVTTADGQIRCWGTDNTYGQLGTGTTTAVATPTTVVGLPTGVAMQEVRFMGWTSVCGRASDGRLFCWGDNTFGQLGDGSTITRSIPVQVQSGATFTAFHPSATDIRQCAVSSSGDSWCWGAAPLGNGTFTASSVPVLIPVP